MREITHLLEAAAAGDRQAAADLLPLVYDEFPEAAELVKLRFFAGMTLGDAAKARCIPRRTADWHWAFARAWLADALGRG
jgi:hypothetical protein